MRLQFLEWCAEWPLVLPFYYGLVPAGFPSPGRRRCGNAARSERVSDSKQGGYVLMRVDGDSMKDAGILDGDLLESIEPRSLALAAWLSWR